MQHGLTLLIMAILQRLFGRPAAQGKHRRGGRIVLFVLSLGFVLSSLAWATHEGKVLSIGDAVAAGLPQWMLLWPLAALLCLLLVVRNPAGLSFVLVFGGMLLVVLAFAVLLSFENAPGIDLYVGPVFNLAGSFVLLLVAAFMIFGDPVPLTSPLVHLAYPGAVGHLRGVYRLAEKWGWQASGPEGPLHAVRVAGRWGDRDLLLLSGTHFSFEAGDSYHFLQVALSTRRELRPFLVGVGSQTAPSKAERAAALTGTCQTSGRKIATFYVWDMARSGTEQGAVRQMQAVLNVGRSYLRNWTALRSGSSVLSFERRSSYRMSEQEEALEGLLRWLADVAHTMEDGGLAKE